MKLEGIYHNPRNKMMMMRIIIRAVVRKVKQESLFTKNVSSCLLVIKGAFLSKKI